MVIDPASFIGSAMALAIFVIGVAIGVQEIQRRRKVNKPF